MNHEALTPDVARQTGAILREANAILEKDHFVSINGHHSEGWIDKDAIKPHVDRGNVTARDLGGYPCRHLLQWKVPSWPEAGTPAHIMERPVNTKLAHGAEYLARKLSRIDSTL